MFARRYFMLLVVSVAGFIGTPSAALAETPESDRPNILWISCEDLSPILGCYGDRTATTPNLDRLATAGTLFTHAFSCHGVCAPSRTGIITGMHPISLGANHMRSKVRLPSHVQLFPALLRKAGYFCTNNSKTDYNLEWPAKDVWDINSAKAHWKARSRNDQPFFAVFNLTMTHESKVWPSGWKDVVADLPEAQRHRAEDMAVPAIFPDTPAVREDMARLADLATVMDQKVGELLAELKAAGQDDNTIVFFWSDHGNGLPRCKRWTYDSGSRVPLIVRVPEKWRAKLPGLPPGSRDDRLVSLLDLAPTVLNIAGIDKPEHMHGQSLIGSDNSRQYIHGARDRLDERFDLVRTVRSRRFRYVRNLMPWRPALQHVAYGEQNETMKELRRHLAQGDLAPASAQWFQTPRSAEELYDLENDPWEIHNLANSADHKSVLEELRAECTRWQLDVKDAHLVPESLFEAEEKSSGTRWGIFHSPEGAERLAKILDQAVTASHLDSRTANEDSTQLSNDPVGRWWQVTLMAKADRVSDRTESLLKELESTIPEIRLAAAAGLARTNQKARAVEVFRDLLTNGTEFQQHAALVELDELEPSFQKELMADLPRESKGEYIQRMVKHLTGEDGGE